MLALSTLGAVVVDGGDAGVAQHGHGDGLCGRCSGKERSGGCSTRACVLRQRCAAVIRNMLQYKGVSNDKADARTCGLPQTAVRHDREKIWQDIDMCARTRNRAHLHTHCDSVLNLIIQRALIVKMSNKTGSSIRSVSCSHGPTESC